MKLGAALLGGQPKSSQIIGRPAETRLANSYCTVLSFITSMSTLSFSHGLYVKVAGLRGHILHRFTVCNYPRNCGFFWQHTVISIHQSSAGIGLGLMK